MVCVVQRVKSSNLFIDNKLYSSIGQGLVVLAGFSKDDTLDDLNWMANKILNLRIFENDMGKFDLSVSDIAGELLIVSQFTLLGDVKKGRRPDFTYALEKGKAAEYYDIFVDILRKNYLPEKIKTGVFQAEMLVEINNDGPVTIIIDSKR